MLRLGRCAESCAYINIPNVHCLFNIRKRKENIMYIQTKCTAMPHPCNLAWISTAQQLMQYEPRQTYIDAFHKVPNYQIMYLVVNLQKCLLSHFTRQRLNGNRLAERGGAQEPDATHSNKKLFQEISLTFFKIF